MLTLFGEGCPHVAVRSGCLSVPFLILNRLFIWVHFLLCASTDPEAFLEVLAVNKVHTVSMLVLLCLVLF